MSIKDDCVSILLSIVVATVHDIRYYFCYTTYLRGDNLNLVMELVSPYLVQARENIQGDHKSGAEQSVLTNIGSACFQYGQSSHPLDATPASWLPFRDNSLTINTTKFLAARTTTSISKVFLLYPRSQACLVHCCYFDISGMQTRST